MDTDEIERRFKAAIEQLRLTPEQAHALAAGLVATDKSAKRQKIAFKSAVASEADQLEAEINAAGLDDTVIDAVWDTYVRVGFKSAQQQIARMTGATFFSDSGLPLARPVRDQYGNPL